MTDDTTKKKVLARLRRIASQVEGIAWMLDEVRRRPNTLVQIASAQAALGQAGKLVLHAPRGVLRERGDGGGKTGRPQAEALTAGSYRGFLELVPASVRSRATPSKEER